MSEKLPTVSAKAMTRILLRLGFVEKTLRTIMESAALTADDLRTLL